MALGNFSHGLAFDSSMWFQAHLKLFAVFVSCLTILQKYFHLNMHTQYFLIVLHSCLLILILVKATSLDRKCKVGSQKINDCQQKIEETWAIAKEEAATCKAAKEVIKALQLRVIFFSSLVIYLFPQMLYFLRCRSRELCEGCRFQLS